MVPVGLSAMFESGRGAPSAGDLSVVACDAEPDTSAEMLTGTWAIPVVLSRPSGVDDNGRGADQGSSANATGPGLDVIGAVETVGEAVGPARRILVHAHSRSENGVESPALSAPYG
jgi:hypothetical protein